MVTGIRSPKYCLGKTMKKLHGFSFEWSIRRSIIPLISKQKTSSISIKTVFSVMLSFPWLMATALCFFSLLTRNKLTCKTRQGLQLQSSLLFPASCPGNYELSSLCISPMCDIWHVIVNETVRSDGQPTQVDHNRFSHAVRVRTSWAAASF